MGTVYILVTPDKGPIAATLHEEIAENLKDKEQERLEFAGSRQRCYITQLELKT